MEDTFKSPVRKLTRFFKKSRDGWKQRAKKSTNEIRAYKRRIRFLETSKAALKDQARDLKIRILALEDTKKNKLHLH